MTKIGKDGAMTGKRSSAATSGGCDPCGTGRRNRYFRDKRMHVADHVLEQDYHIFRRRLVNRTMLGWGVAEGFAVKAAKRELLIGPGVGLDLIGREVVACEVTRLARPGDVIWLAPDAKGCGLSVVAPPGEEDCKPPPCEDQPKQEPARLAKEKPDASREEKAREAQAKAREDEAKAREAPTRDKPQDEHCEPEPDCANLYLLRAHYAELQVDGVRIEDDCGGDRCEANHICETVVYSLEAIDCCPSGLPGCHPHFCADESQCACEGERESCDECDERGKLQHGPALDRGPHRQLAKWSESFGGIKPCDKGCLEHAGCVAFDADAGIPLACVTIGFHCGEPYVDAIVDDLGPRRLARPNEVLFDLSRGCDLVRIADVSWRDWLEGDCRVPFSRFADMFEPPKVPGGKKGGRKQRETVPVNTRFEVEFTGPVKVESLTVDSVAVTLVQRAVREDVGNMVRMPVVGLVPRRQSLKDPAGTTRSFTIQVDPGFYEGEITLDTASGFEEPTIVEFELRCEFMLDCNGQPITGGGRRVPSTGTVPGLPFHSVFTVIPDDQFADDANSRQED